MLIIRFMCYILQAEQYCMLRRASYKNSPLKLRCADYQYVISSWVVMVALEAAASEEGESHTWFCLCDFLHSQPGWGPDWGSPDAAKGPGYPYDGFADTDTFSRFPL